MSDQGGGGGQPQQPQTVVVNQTDPPETPPAAQESDLQRAERLALLEERVNPLLEVPQRLENLESSLRTDLQDLRESLQRDREEREQARMEAQEAAAAAASAAAETLENIEESTNPDGGSPEDQVEIVQVEEPPAPDPGANPPAPTERKSKLRGWF